MDEVALSSGSLSTAHAQMESARRKAPTVLEKQRSSTEIRGSAMGTKTASLFLSRTKSSLKSSSVQKDGEGFARQEGVLQNRARMGSPGNTIETASVTSKSTSIPSFQKEFTFTGYDIMADVAVEPVERKKEKPTAKDIEKQQNVQLYIGACKKLGLNPVNYLVRHINDIDLIMKSHPLGPEGTRAMCIALVNNRFVRTLNLEDNGVGPDGAMCITEMLKENDKITEIHLAENWIGTRGAFSFMELLKDGKLIHSLDISGSSLEDSDGKYIAEIIEFSKHLKVLKVSHNQLGEESGFEIGRAIAINDKLQNLDLSWNHFRGKSALAIAMGVQRNVGLRVINLSWNGMAIEGSKGIGEALKQNNTLVEMDLSNNRIGVESVGFILKGLQQNEGLKTLKMGQNPFSPEVALTILKSIQESEICVLTTLDLSDVVVREDFVKLWQEIKENRPQPLRIVFGAMVKGLQFKSTEDYGIDWRDPVMRMYKFMQDSGYRVIDLLKRLDKDKNFSVDRAEFKHGLLSENIPMTEAQLDEVIDKLDTDGDGEVDLAELIKGEKEFKRKSRARMKMLLRQANTVDAITKKLKRIEEH